VPTGTAVASPGATPLCCLQGTDLGPPDGCVTWWP
jgi:hypothetical protein